MKSGKKITLGFLTTFLCVLIIILSACDSGGTIPTITNTKVPDDQQVLRYPIVGDIKTLDPALVEDSNSNFPVQDIFTGLVTLDKDLKVKMQLAAGYAVSADGLTYTFKLKPNLKFSDGSPLTSEDVVYSINRTIAPQTESNVSGYLQMLKDFDKASNGSIPTLIGDSLLTPDDSTVVMNLAQPAAYFLQSLSYSTSYVVKQSLVEKYGGSLSPWTDHLDEGAGAGPFKVIKYDHQTGIELVRNDNYYGPKPQLSKLEVIFYPDQDSMYRAYRSNQLDFTYVPATNVASEQRNPEFRQINLLAIRYIAFNYLAKPFDNIKIRQAFALGINKSSVVQSALKDTVTATNHLIPSGMPGYNSDLETVNGTTNTTGNIAKARQLLQDGMSEAGYPTLPPITLTFYPHNQNVKKAVAAFVQQWQNNLGVKISLNQVDRKTLLNLEDATTGNSSLQMWLAGWNADYPDPQDWLSTFFSKGSNHNQFNYGQNQSSDAIAQQAVQEELATADATQNLTTRLKLYNDAEQKISNDVGWLPLWQERLQTLTRSYVKNLVLNSRQLIPPDDWSQIYIVQH